MPSREPVMANVGRKKAFGYAQVDRRGLLSTELRLAQSAELVCRKLAPGGRVIIFEPRVGLGFPLAST